MLALIMMQVDVTFFSYLELRSPLVTDDPPDQTEAHVVRRQCAEVPGQRALSSHDGMGLIKAASRGGGADFHYLVYLPILPFGFQFARQKLARPKKPSKLIAHSETFVGLGKK
jgi:hypothetical protein